MKGAQQSKVEAAFMHGEAREVRVIRRADKQYYFTFVIGDPITGTPGTYVLLTQKGALRTWADPRALHDFLLLRCNVQEFTTILVEDLTDENSSGAG